MNDRPAFPDRITGSPMIVEAPLPLASREFGLKATEISSRRLTLFGFSVVSVFFGGFAAWSALAPLESAVVADGQVIVASSRNVVQSEKGGVVREILHRDGDRVTAGSILVRLDSTKASAVFQLLLGRSYEVKALRARLEAERDGLDAIQFPPDLAQDAADPGIQAAVGGQMRVFDVRRGTILNQTAILNQKIEEYNEEIKGLRIQIAAQSEQLNTLTEETADLGQLVDKGLSSKSRLLELRRTASNIKGAQGENQAEIARVEQAISAARLQMLDLKNRQMDEVVSQLREVDAELSDLEEKLRAAGHDLKETEVSAPKSGIIVGTTIHTVGGVVAPGALMMEIVPDNEQLIVEARIRPQDIDYVKEGQLASVRLIGFNLRVTPTVDGKVTYVSADSLVDQTTKMSYYLAKIEVDLRAKPDTANLKLQPGMPTQVMVITGTRTLLDYLLAPITDGISRAFRES